MLANDQVGLSYAASHEAILQAALVKHDLWPVGLPLPQPAEAATGVAGVSSVYFLYLPNSNGSGRYIVAKFDERSRSEHEWEALEDLRRVSVPLGILKPIEGNRRDDGVLIFDAAEGLVGHKNCITLLKLLQHQIGVNTSNCIKGIAKTFSVLAPFYAREPGRPQKFNGSQKLVWNDVLPIYKNTVSNGLETAKRHFPTVDWTQKTISLPGIGRALPNPLHEPLFRSKQGTGAIQLSRIHGDLNLTNVLVAVEANREVDQALIIDLANCKPDRPLASDFARFELEVWRNVISKLPIDETTLLQSCLQARDCLDGRLDRLTDSTHPGILSGIKIVNEVRRLASQFLKIDRLTSTPYTLEDFFHCLYFLNIRALSYEDVRNSSCTAKVLILGSALTLEYLNELNAGSYASDASHKRWTPPRASISVERNGSLPSSAVGATASLSEQHTNDILTFEPSGTVEAAASSRPQSAFESPLTEAERHTVLKRVQEAKIDPKLHRNLRQAVRIDLKLTETPPSITPPLNVLDETKSSIDTKAIHQPIDEVFKRMDGGLLLILGEPGSGKTNLLLEIGESLVRDASQDVRHPIPIVFNLSTWTHDQQNRPLDEWMSDDLKRSYGVNADAADALVQHGLLLPLFDGLDEVASARRAECVDAIVAFQTSAGLPHMALCCRSSEYQNLSKKLIARITVRVERLTPEDVDRAIAHPSLEYVRRALIEDPELRLFIDAPLWLHVLFLAATIPVDGEAQADPMRRLYGRYVKYALGRPRSKATRKRTSANDLLSWLTLLAHEMQERQQAQFDVDQLDMSWALLDHKNQTTTRRPSPQPSHNQPLPSQGAIKLWQRAAFGLAGFFIGWFFDSYLLGHAEWLGIVLAVFAASRVEGRVDAAEDLQFSFSSGYSRWRLLVISGAVFGTIFGWGSSVAGGIFVGLLVALFEFLQGGYQARSVSRGLTPNYKTSQSLRHALRILGIGAASGALLISIGKANWSEAYSLFSHHDFIRAGTWVIVGAAILAGEKGGWFVLRHYFVRLILRFRNFAPLRYVRFLREADDRLFLVERGNSYEFIHLTFRDYMATLQESDIDRFVRYSSSYSGHPQRGATISKLAFAWTNILAAARRSIVRASPI